MQYENTEMNILKCLKNRWKPEDQCGYCQSEGGDNGISGEGDEKGSDSGYSVSPSVQFS